LIFDTITQPFGGNNLDALHTALSRGGVDQIDVAGAYATFGGVQPLIECMSDAIGDAWPGVRKRWLIAFDYLRSEPIALKRLHALPGSRVRIHDGAGILARQCVPKIPFHPKTFIMRGPTRCVVMAGSGNLSRSGLTRGHEVGILADVSIPPQVGDAPTHTRCEAVSDWFQGMWNDATRLNDVYDRYERLYDASSNLENPTPTEDDTAPEPTRGALTMEELRRIRACRHLWIETGNITRNRGRNLPGNQLMMKRMSRVFFGVPAADVPIDTLLANPVLSYNGQSPTCSLTYSNNRMDKLTLPIPGGGIPVWDQSTILFVKKPTGAWDISVGSERDVRGWRRSSQALDTEFRMAQGRSWGVF